MVIITDGKLTAEITANVKGNEVTKHFLVDQGIIPSKDGNTQVPNVTDIVSELSDWEEKEPERDAEVTFIDGFPGFHDIEE